VCANEHDTGEQRQPREPPRPNAVSPPAPRTPGRSSLLLTLRVSRRPQPDGVPLQGKDPLPVSEPTPPRQPKAASEPRNADEPQTARARRSGGDPSRQPTQAQTPGKTSTGIYATRRLDASLVVIGAVLFFCALTTLISTWAWSWHARSGGTFNLSHMHGICTSAMGELAQGASGTVANHCLWVDNIWTEAVALTGAGCIVAVIGITRTLRALRTPT
jgi:hypothetical protein